MPLSWNEIKERAVRFAQEWKDATNEEADAKPFLEGFFEVFGITRRRVATFEYKVKKLGEADGYIDLLWKGVILVEMKSRGKNLDRAYEQAREYTHGLKEEELPRFILVSDFERFRLHDLEDGTIAEFRLDELVGNVQLFGAIIGYQKKVFQEQDPANIKAAELMGRLHDRLEEIGYTGHPLEVYLVRILFCLFADDTTIFNKQQFQDFLEQRTQPDGSDLAARLAELFQVLNTPREKRLKNLDEQLAEFPYVNGRLFEEPLPLASFDAKMRKALLDCCSIDWARISPAIFGSMFQSVMNPQERRNLGAHYTSEKNILKLIRPLFLDALWEEFESVKGNRARLGEFHKKLASLRFLDPACGCGNFLVITYRELRLLELEVLRSLYKGGQGLLDIREVMLLNVDQLYGIEIEEFPARIAEVAMWLIDHQMNMLVSNEFGQYFVRLPLQKAANIYHGDALEVDWCNIIDKRDISYIIGNPPFIGSKLMKPAQRSQVVKIFNGIDGAGVLDYVCAWYAKAAKFIQGTTCEVAYVSTNSIVQGEQVGILWSYLILKKRMKINFAHRTFKWTNEAKGKAAVYCVIIGFSLFDRQKKYIYDYSDVNSQAHLTDATKINPYLLDGPNLVIEKRSNPLCAVPDMSFGNMPLDGGNLIVEDEEYLDFLRKEPLAKSYLKPLVSAHEFLNGGKRWCLWLVDVDPVALRKMPMVIHRVEAVRKFRLASKAPSTKKFAQWPSLFRDKNNPESAIVVPRVSSENRRYIPMGFFTKEYIISDTCMYIPNGTLYHFGVLMSDMHMAWVRTVCGRLESRYRYSKDIVYNNFPWPESPSEKQKAQIEQVAQAVLDARAQFPESSLADLYDPLTMPPVLLKAHQELDKAVDLAYRPQPFPSEAKRMEFLFELYEKYTAGLFGGEKKGKKKKSAKA
jgi:hypothetical protein